MKSRSSPADIAATLNPRRGAKRKATAISESKEDTLLTSPLTIELERVSLSFEYDAVTIAGKENCPCLCCHLHLHDIERFIHQDEDDHALYHRGTHEVDPDHTHVKFADPLNHEAMVALLKSLVSGYFIRETEKQLVLQMYAARFKETRKRLAVLLAGDDKPVVAGTEEKSEPVSANAADIAIILSFIKQCESVDILLDLHTYLLLPQFNYLRKTDHAESTRYPWLGTTASGDVKETSHDWAYLEKMLSLQIAHCIKRNTRFNAHVGLDRGEQLLETTGFFGLSRNNPRRANSPTFEAFAKGDGKAIESKHAYYFKKF